MQSHYNVKCSLFILSMCHYFLPQFSNTLTHLSHLVTSLKTLSRYKLALASKTIHEQTLPLPRCGISDFQSVVLVTSTNYVSWSVILQHNALSPHSTLQDTRIVALVSLHTPGPVIFETPGTSHPTTGCHIQEDFLTLLQNSIHTLVNMCLGLLQNCANIAA